MPKPGLTSSRLKRKGRDHRVEDEEQLEPALVKKGRKEDKDYKFEMLKLFECFVERGNGEGRKDFDNDEVGRPRHQGHVFVRCQFAARAVELGHGWRRSRLRRPCWRTSVEFVEPGDTKVKLMLLQSQHPIEIHL